MSGKSLYDFISLYQLMSKQKNKTVILSTNCLNRIFVGLSSYKRDVFFTLLGVLLGALISIPITMWGVDYDNNVQLEKEINEKTALDPNITLQVYNWDNYFDIQFNHDKIGGNKIDKLVFDLTIPGLIDNISKVVENEQIGECDYDIYPPPSNSNFKMSSQRLFITCSDIYPKAEEQILVTFTPYDQLEPNRFLDFIDYAQYQYYWTYNGKLIDEKRCVDLSNFTYIKRGNEKHWLILQNLGNSVSKDWIDFLEREKERNPCLN